MMDDIFDGYEGNDFLDETSEHEASESEEDWDFDWFDLATAGALSEEIAEEEIKRRELERELSEEQDLMEDWDKDY